jgi:hypothetical protein
MRSYKVFSIRLLVFALALLLAQSVWSQSAKAAKNDVNVSFKDVRPSGKFTPFDGQGFTLAYPDNWHSATGKDAILIGPPEAMGDSGIAYGVIVGTGTAAEGVSQDEVTRQLAKGLITQNSGMRVSGDPQRITANGVEGRALELLGNSPLQKNGQPLPEHDWLVAFPRGEGGVLYLVFISPERDFRELHPVYQKMVDSLQLH